MIKRSFFMCLLVAFLFLQLSSSGSAAYAEAPKGELFLHEPMSKFDQYDEMSESRKKVATSWHDLAVRHFRQDTGQVEYRHYDINIYLHPVDHFLTGYATVVFRSKVSQLPEVNFIMYNDSLEIANVIHGSDTLGFSYDSVSWLLRVNLNDTLNIGQEDSVRIYYSGYITPQLSQTLWNFCRLDSLLGYCTYFPYVWYPMPYDQHGVHRWMRWASGRVSLTVPQGWTAVSNGALLDSSSTDSTRTYSWGTDKTVVEFVFAAAPYLIVEWQQSGVDFRYYDFDTTGCQSLMSTAGSIFDFYTDTFCSYSFEKMALVDILQSDIGYSEYTIVASAMPASLDMMGHEIAHQWWAHIVSQRYTDEDWISESFADYSTHLFREDSLGSSAMMAALQTVASYYLYVPPGQDVPVIPSPFNSIYYWAIMYGKGVWVFHMLRGIVGDSTFFDVLQTYAGVYTDSSATAEMFQGVAGQMSGQTLDWFFDEWLYRAGYPKYVTYIYYKTHPDSNSAIARIHQSASIGDLFKMPITLACSTSVGRRDTVVWDSLEWHECTLEDTLPIVTVLFDPAQWILKRHTDSLPRPRSIVPGNQQITLFWSQYHDDPLPAGYNLYRSLDINGPFERLNQYIITDTTYVDTGLTNGTPYYYRITAVNSADTCYETKFSNIIWSTPQGIEDESDVTIAVRGYRLGQNHPNPFLGQTRISGRIPEAGPVTIIVYNCAGQEVRNIHNWAEQSGEFSILWDGRDNAGKVVASGIYFYSLETRGTQIFRQLVKID